MQNYVELELVGKGSYGKVFKVKSLADQQNYVLKKVAFDGSGQNEAEASLREAQVLSSLRHPHIVPYKEFFKHDDGDLCLVMAFCEGGDLFHYIKQLRRSSTKMDENLAWQWLVQLLLALSYCHSKKILHRDVKSQNIFISEGKVLLGDFGLAKQLQRTIEMARTPIGTPYYMAPEIYEEQPYSYKSDVWALGCVMYEMLTGRPAFAADNLSRVVIRVIRGNYDPIPTHFSQEMREIVGSMLCKTVKNRPEVNDLLQHPSVVRHVQQYLDSLSAAGPAGWSTWRMKLPPSMLAQLAAVVAKSRLSSNGEAVSTGGELRGGYAASPPTPAAPPPPAAVVQQPEVRRNLLPQQLEDALSDSALIDGFSLQSLLKDLPPPAMAAPTAQQDEAMGMAAGGDSMVLGSMDGQQMQQVVAGLKANQLPGTAEPALELLLLTHQVAGLVPAPPSVLAPLPAAAAHAAWAITTGGGYGDIAPDARMMTASFRRPAVKRTEQRETDASGWSEVEPGVTGGANADVSWLAGALPSAGFQGAVQPAWGEPATVAGPNPGSMVYRRYTSSSSVASEAPALVGPGGAAVAEAPPLAGIVEEHTMQETGDWIVASAVAGSMMRPGRLPPIASHATPLADSWKQPMPGDKSLQQDAPAAIAAVRPCTPARDVAAATGGTDKGISLPASRAFSLRQQLEQQLGAGVLSEALQAVRAAQLQQEQPPGSGLWTGSAVGRSLDGWADPGHSYSFLVSEISYMLSQGEGATQTDDERVSDLLPMLDELLFLEAQLA